MPRVLSFQDTETLAGPPWLRPPPRCATTRCLRPKPWTGPKQRRTASASVVEVEVEATAGPGAWHEDFVHEKARWRLPHGMVRHEGDADPDALRILRVRGNSMEPELREGDRLVFDTARRVPRPGRALRALGRRRSHGQARRGARGEGHAPPRLRAPPTIPPTSARPMRSTSSARFCGRSPAPETAPARARIGQPPASGQGF